MFDTFSVEFLLPKSIQVGTFAPYASKAPPYPAKLSVIIDTA